jgi:hypothetical protein
MKHHRIFSEMLSLMEKNIEERSTCFVYYSQVELGSDFYTNRQLGTRLNSNEANVALRTTVKGGGIT